MSEDLTPEKVLFIEQKTQAMFDYTIACLDRAQSEGTVVLQWFFGAVAGGLGLVGSLAPKGYWSLAGGFLAVSVWAAYSAACLVRGLRSRETMPPGNFCEYLNTLLDEPEHRMRWREAMGMDGRIRQNTEYVDAVAKCVDRARDRFALIPVLFVGGIVVAWLLIVACKSNPTIFRWITSAAAV